MSEKELFFRFIDDDGKQRSLKVNDAYYVPRLKLRLFSPQQWSRQEPCYKDGTPVRAESTNRETMTLFFHRGHKIIPHDSKTKLPILYSSTGCEDFSTFAQNAKMATWEARIHPTPETFDKTILVESIFRDSKLKKQIDMELEKIDQEKTEEIPNAQAEGSTKKKKQDLLMKWHYRLGHIPFKSLQTMSKFGLIDKGLDKVEPPMCPECLFGKQSRRAWRTKPNKKTRKGQIHRATRPGQRVSVDTMTSLSVPGMMAQMRGRPTTKRYNYATVFVDHYSRLDYVHLHERNTATEILDAKLQFERLASSYNVRIQHYHCDNGVFADNNFKQSCLTSRQTFSFCGSNAHHQNGIVERRIRDLRNSAQSMLLMAKHNWPDAITTHLWSFALKYFSQIRQHTIREGDKTNCLANLVLHQI